VTQKDLSYLLLELGNCDTVSGRNSGKKIGWTMYIIFR